MLFTAKINELTNHIEDNQTTIAELEARIEALREENNRIASHLQALGSAESAAESALAQVQNAISMITTVDPSQLDTFRQAIESAFAQDVALLAEPTPETGDDDEIIEVVAEDPHQDAPQDAEMIAAMEFTISELKARLKALGYANPKGNKSALAQMLVSEWKKGGQVSANNDDMALAA
jgi:chromosome segregation ATPase